MKKKQNSQNHPEVLLITNKGGNYGMGHYNRIHLIQEHLRKMKIKSKIEYGIDFRTESITPFKVIILDSRDDGYPEKIIQEKCNYQYLISMDNRGIGRDQGDIVWDTLPHPDMTFQELKTSLRNCILNPVIFNHAARIDKGSINRCRFDDIESGRIQCDLIQYPVNNRLQVSVEDFHTKLIQADSVATYFGQTFFEALYLGKEVYLFDISDYHKQISDWFYDRVQVQPEVINLLDGQGLHRLTVLVRSVISGVLDFPVG